MSTSAYLELLQGVTGLGGVRGAMMATAEGPIGAAEYAHLQPAVASDVACKAAPAVSAKWQRRCARHW